MRELAIDKAAFCHNVSEIIKAVSPSVVIGVCKGDGMGLSALPYAKTLVECGITRLAVATLAEGRKLREGGIETPILMLSSTSVKEEIEELCKLEITPTVGSFAALDVVAEVYGEGDIHINVDTGFGRYGFFEGQEEVLATALAKTSLNVEGLFTHFRSSFSRGGETKEQFDSFMRFKDKLTSCGITPNILHTSNSCGALLHPYTRLDAVRIGSAFLGRLPVSTPLKLKKIGRLRAMVSELHEVKKGSYIGYTDVYKAKSDIKTAVVTAGVADGIGLTRGKDAFRLRDHARYIKRAIKEMLSPPLPYCEVKGQKLFALGRIGLTSTIVDVTGKNIKAGDEAYFEINPIMVTADLPRVWE